MTIFKNTTFTWRQMGMLKLSVLLVGIAIGAHWPEVFARFAADFVVVGVVLGIYLGTVWYRE